MDRRFSKHRWLRRFSRGGRAGSDSRTPRHGLYAEPYFREKLVQERRRAERSNKSLLVMILELNEEDRYEEVTEAVGEGVNTCVRGTDICGLLQEGGVVGVILTEVDPEKVELAKRSVTQKTREALAATLGEETAHRVSITFHRYPEPGDGAIDLTFFPELTRRDAGRIAGDFMKRSLDIAGSLVGLLLFSPFFLVLPVLIKLSSKGPVFFCQDRVGRNGSKFKFLKFRSMYLDNDDVIHREYVKQLIKGNIAADDGNKGIFKIQGDPRVTPLGRILRKYSLDELPQFINVLKGDMSLVGPRPPIAYEVEEYLGWQRNRLIGKRPGITGLWQVTGRSSTSFDDMVRLDLRYLRNWNIVVDLKILLRTPGAVIRCKGAY